MGLYLRMGRNNVSMPLFFLSPALRGTRVNFTPKCAQHEALPLIYDITQTECTLVLAAWALKLQVFVHQQYEPTLGVIASRSRVLVIDPKPQAPKSQTPKSPNLIGQHSPIPNSDASRPRAQGTKTQKAKGIPDNADIFTQATSLFRFSRG